MDATLLLVRTVLASMALGWTMLLGVGCGDQWSARVGHITLPWSMDSLLGSNATPTWEEAVLQCEALAQSDPRATLHHVGWSDVGRPIHALVLSNKDGGVSMDVQGVKDRLHASLGTDGHSTNRTPRLLINNAIHPGEPCGVNASLALAAQWLSEADHEHHLLRHLDVVIIPQYNIGGALRRNCCTRANQNGPEAYGFRGNGSNLDLNRDFVKMDSRNAEAFVSLFHAVDPDVFVDTHTSNGADYPYTMTLITTQPDKAGPVLGPFLSEVMSPALYDGMKAAGWPMVPYVFSRESTPESGIVDFLETPRYSTGYTTLWGTLGFTTEAHMLKPFQDRVQATHAFLSLLASWVSEHGRDVIEVRARERRRVAEASWLPVRWALDDTRWDSLTFSGYPSRMEWSAVHGGKRLVYDRDSVWVQRIRYDNHYRDVDSIQLPTRWVIPQAWRHALERLRMNGVSMRPVDRDTTLLLQVTTIESYQSARRPYEGRHPLSIDGIRVDTQHVQLYAGDVWIDADQDARRYLAEILSPRGHDALLVWNFFDAALQQKEYYSDYVFEDTAEELLKRNSALREEYAQATLAHPEWTSSPGEALRWIYDHSPYAEGTAHRYPVMAWVDPTP